MKQKKIPAHTSKQNFFDLLNKSAMASDVKEVGKKGRQTSGGYNAKRTRQRKVEDASD